MGTPNFSTRGAIGGFVAMQASAYRTISARSVPQPRSLYGSQLQTHWTRCGLNAYHSIPFSQSFCTKPQTRHMQANGESRAYRSILHKVISAKLPKLLACAFPHSDFVFTPTEVLLQPPNSATNTTQALVLNKYLISFILPS